MDRKAQGTLEYAVIIVVVLSALLAMQTYMGRGVQGKLRSSVDSIGEQYVAGNMTSKYTTEQETDMETQETFGLADDRTTISKGRSKYKITTAAAVTRSATGNDAEKLTQELSEDKLFP